ncbi:sulfotransferase [Sphingomonas sp. C3-2]|uniref:sulfotransferase family protein n=1 Tax=Sphingomonas sp. C3-2 TaxID=3062169 RepID=UPI00294B4607|nr:sulfotransferase [Sphingomonas sp. C3-2]WOK36114.1 sulfotransferase [Sphingomonas sp. C3-2]
MSAHYRPSSLLEIARVRTGLEDYGDDWFRAPFEALVGFVNREAGLREQENGPVERIIASLMDRLKLVQLLKQQPQILDEPIAIAGAIVGMPRTGSTMVHRLLASSPQLNSPYWWETTFPLPLDGEDPGDASPRIELAHQTVEYLLKSWPDFESIDPIDAMAVAEEVILLDKTFLSSSWDSMMHVPSYGFWQAEQDHEPAYRELKIWLQVLQSQQPHRRGKKWILKTPHHLLGGMGGLVKVFPEARLIMTHRDPAEVLPSYCSMCASMTINASSTYRKEDQGAYWTARFLDGLKRFDALRSELGEGAVFDVHYRNTVSNPVDTGRAAMAAMGLEFTAADAAAMEACVASNAREKRPKHKYSMEEFGLSIDRIQADFAPYLKGLPAA